MAIEFSTPSFKPREYEGEYILYTLYGLDSDGDELDDIITSPKKSTVVHTIKELRPDYRRIYNGMHVTAILYDKNYRMLDSEVVWSTDQNEANGADETIEYEKGHKNSRGEDAPWVIRDHKNGKVLASFSKKDDAEAHLERMKHYSKDEKLFNKQPWGRLLKKSVEEYDDEYDDDNVKDAKECKAALDKYVLGLESMKDLGLETVLTEDVSIGAEMPCARVELGVRKDGKLDPFFTFDFSGGMCSINFHLVKEEWDEVLSDHPSVDAMIEDLIPDILDEIESQ